MKLYRVEITERGGESLGYLWDTSKERLERAADVHKRETPENNHGLIERIEIGPRLTRIKFLNFARKYASHNDNG